MSGKIDTFNHRVVSSETATSKGRETSKMNGGTKAIPLWATVNNHDLKPGGAVNAKPINKEKWRV